MEPKTSIDLTNTIALKRIIANKNMRHDRAYDFTTPPNLLDRIFLQC